MGDEAVRYYLDTEFNEFGGELLSLALVCEDGQSLYIVNGAPKEVPGPWVKENVLPLLYETPRLQWSDQFKTGGHYAAHPLNFPRHILAFLHGDSDPVVITDWPDDIRYFCQCLITGPGQMINIPGIKFEMVREDAYPTALPGAIQHNAYWDAMALRHKLTGAA